MFAQRLARDLVLCPATQPSAASRLAEAILGCESGKRSPTQNSNFYTIAGATQKKKKKPSNGMIKSERQQEKLSTGGGPSTLTPCVVVLAALTVRGPASLMPGAK